MCYVAKFTGRRVRELTESTPESLTSRLPSYADASIPQPM